MKPGSRTHALTCRTLLKKGIDGEESEGVGGYRSDPGGEGGEKVRVETAFFTKAQFPGQKWLSRNKSLSHRSQ